MTITNGSYDKYKSYHIIINKITTKEENRIVA